jgi:phosphoenolpyruvate-protein kinase (PTS system EI component)
VLQGIGITKGIAIGMAFLYRPAALAVVPRKAAKVVAEMARFEEALERVRQEVQSLRAAMPAVLRPEVDRLLEVPALLLADPALVDRTRGAILEGRPAEVAWKEAVDSYLAIFASIRDEDLRSRAEQLGDVGRRVLAALLGTLVPSPFAASRNAVVVAEGLGPNEVLQLVAQPPLGLCLAGGSLTSPAAVVARRLGLPAVVGLGEGLLAQVQPNSIVVVDGTTGVVEIGADSAALFYYRERQRLLKTARPALDVSAPALTADGWRVDVRVDLEQPAGLLQALTRGAEGVGLARTDFLFLGQQSPPSEEEQATAYRQILEQTPPGRLTFCTLSVGPEETLPFSAEPEIRNPLLGLRGVRLSLAYLSAFREQLRAILQAGAGRPIGIAFPMVEMLSEARAAQEWLRRAQQDMANAQVPHSQDVTVALLLQTPVAILNLDALSEGVTGFFLDLDRLTEYLLACDRRNLRVAHLFRPLHPAVLRLVKDAIGVVHRLGQRLDLCGDAAGNPGAVALLLGLGADGFCLPMERIGVTKALLRRLAVPEVQALAEQALRMQTAAEVEALVEDFLECRTPKDEAQGEVTRGPGEVNKRNKVKEARRRT